MVKKIHALLSGGRFAIVRQIMQESTLDEVKEFLLLASKSHSLSDHDQKIFRSLAEVAHPSLLRHGKNKSLQQNKSLKSSGRQLQDIKNYSNGSNKSPLLKL